LSVKLLIYLRKNVQRVNIYSNLLSAFYITVKARVVRAPITVHHTSIMPLSKVYESDTAEEEESAPSILPKDSKSVLVESDTGSEKSIKRYTRFLPLKIIQRRIPLSPKITNNEPVIRPPKPRVKSRIGGRKRNQKEIKERTPTPPTSPPSKRRKENSSPAVEKNDAQRIVNEVIFQHSGKPNPLLADGAVSLFPKENSHALGGFSVRIEQNGNYVGEIKGGQEVECRKLLVCVDYLLSFNGRLKDGKQNCDILGAGGPRWSCEVISRNDFMVGS
jgi:hypothetical protein